MDIYKATQEKTEELTDKHWEECRQIALYDDQLRKALALLDKVDKIHYAAIRGKCYEVAVQSSALMSEIKALKREITGEPENSEVQHEETD